jgi:uncharacterized metal-binding protein
MCYNIINSLQNGTDMIFDLKAKKNVDTIDITIKDKSLELNRIEAIKLRNLLNRFINGDLPEKEVIES